MNEAPSGNALDWVLVLAPFRKDADYIAAFLREQKVAVNHVRADEDLVPHLASSPGLIVITHEALSPGVVAAIAKHLAAQPDWSEVPVLVLLERAAPVVRIRSQLERKWPGARLVFHMRPIAQLELVNSIQSNLLVRLRQKQVRDAIDREVELRLELNHRIKNILASVTSIFQMTRRGASTIDDLSKDFTGRLQALASVHTAVFEAGGEEVSLSSVTDLIVSPYNSNGLIRIHVSGPDVAVSRNAATTIALCIHELITNAIKYGALLEKDGSVNIAWTISGHSPPMFSLHWTETNGPKVIEPTRQGYGTRYVRSALGSLFGSPPQIAFDPSGFQCGVAGPLDRLRQS
ncbi:sensor histidine kinase [Pararhizobium sp. DWP1-1-3]|uniref:sensor histidine kinase n=1 Tax=Pararhizobium sp. DWP1-1-3 TaxID=2804652 RepID=UPI003CF518E6